jgi:Uncharacterized conserved protein
MSLEKKVMQSLKEAMKNKDQASLRGVRAIKAAITLAKTDGSGKELDSAREIKILQKLVKQRQESRDIFIKQGREDLAQVEIEEIQVIQKFLPEQMDPAELTIIVKDIIQQVGASSMKDMGKVMGMAGQKLAGRADGKALAQTVKQLLS